jgi:hypothetical protein
MSTASSSFWKHALLRCSACSAPLPAALETSTALPPNSEQPLSMPHGHDHPSQHPSAKRAMPAYKHAQHAVYDAPSGMSFKERVNSMHAPGNGSRAADSCPQQSLRQKTGRRVQSTIRADTSALKNRASARTRPMSEAPDHAHSIIARDGRQYMPPRKQAQRPMPDRSAAAAVRRQSSRAGTSTARSRLQTPDSLQLECIWSTSDSSCPPYSMIMNLQSSPKGCTR